MYMNVLCLKIKSQSDATNHAFKKMLDLRLCGKSGHYGGWPKNSNKPINLIFSCYMIHMYII